MSDVEDLATRAIQCGFEIHRDLGPGLLESCYEVLLAASLARAGLAVERQKVVDIEYNGFPSARHSAPISSSRVGWSSK